jgi:hypothetical protein
LEGIVTLPAHFEIGKKYPFLVLPHGGPEGNDTLDFDMFSRLIAGFGYAVMQPQYRGSTGYGADFMNALYQHFGDRAYEDVDTATDYAVAQGLGRSPSFGDLWMERRRIYDRLDGHTDTSLQGGHRRRGNHGLAELHPTSDIAQVDSTCAGKRDPSRHFSSFHRSCMRIKSPHRC